MAAGVEVINLTSDDELDSGHGDCTILPSSPFLQQLKEEDDDDDEEEEEEEEEEEDDYDDDDVDVDDEDDDEDDEDDAEDEEDDSDDADVSDDEDYSSVDDEEEVYSEDVSPRSEDTLNKVDKIKLDDCKDYLRKYKLRLTGSKLVLVRRIQEHKEITNGGGMAKYPRSSFTKNCTGDACTGDIVRFKQRVYENFDLASRSSKEPPIGKREVAGRIVKESYGAKKQQHTFTIEVLWSRGVRALPPLHPMKIKGRNLYRLQTFRQPWDNEEERRRILKDKHERGAKARQKRDLRKETKANHSVQTKNTKNHTARLNKLKGPKNKKENHKDGSSSSLSRTERSSLGGALNMKINSSYVGIIIGKQGRNIKEIERLSGAKLQVRECRDKRSRTLEIRGANEQIHNAKDMVDKCLQRKKGFV